MSDEEMKGQLVMVHPDLPEDSYDKTGEIARVVVAEFEHDAVRVKFDDDSYGLYATDALLIFRPSEELYQQLKQDAQRLSTTDFKDLKDIARMLDSQTPERQRAAMELAKNNPGLVASTMATIEDAFGLNQRAGRGR